MEIQFELNGKPTTITAEGDRTLLWVLRSDMELTGTKFGCGSGFCGSCTVLVDGKPLRSCQYPVQFVQGKKVTTIEGLSTNGELHPIQEAFVEHDALQCGFCTPGMIMNAHGLLADNPNPTRAEIDAGMAENLCRCGAHVRIIDAIETASKNMTGGAR